jgi:PAS domain S-box-containing protein
MNDYSPSSGADTMSGPLLSRMALFALFYFLCAEAGNYLTIGQEYFAAFWPASGLYLAVLLINPRKTWWIFLLAGYPANILSDLVHQRPMLISACYATANALEAFIAAYLVQRVQIRYAGKAHQSNVLIGLAAAIFGGTAVGATLGSVVTHGIVTTDAALIPSWLHWWSGDVLGILTVTPLIIYWRGGMVREVAQSLRSVRVIPIALIAGCLLAWWFIFTGLGGWLFSQKWLALILLTCMAIWMPLRGFSILALVFSLFCLYSAFCVGSPVLWLDESMADRLFAVQLYIFFGISLSYFLKYLNREREQLVDQLAGTAQRLLSISASAPVGVLITRDGLIRFCNQEALALLGRESAESLYGQPLHHCVDAEAWTQIEQTIADAHEAKAPGRPVVIRMTRDGGKTAYIEVLTVRMDSEGITELQHVLRDVTAQRQAEAALQESEARLQRVFRTMTDGLINVDAEGQFTQCNPAALAILEMTEEQLMGRSAIDSRWTSFREDGTALPIDEQPVVISLRTGRPVTDTLGLEFPSGERRWIRVIATPYNGKGKPNDDDASERCVLVTFTDITERKQIEDALLDERWRLASIIEGTRVGTWEWNVQTNEITLNERWAEMVGYTLEELTPHCFDLWASLVHPEDLERSNELVQRHFAGELADYELECRLRHKDGHWVWILARGRLLTRTADGQPLMMFGTHTNISQRKQAEAESREKDIRLQKLATHMPGMLYQFMMKPDGSFTIPFTTEAITRVFRCTPEEVRSDFSPIVRVLHPDDIDRVIQTILESARTLTTWQCEYRIRIPGEPDRWLWGSSMPELLDDGSIIWHGYNADITERKQIEDSLRIANERFKLAQQSAQIGIWDWNIGTGFIDWTLGMYEMFGIDPARKDNLFAAWEDALHPDDREEAKERISQALEQHALLDSQYRIVMPSGEVRWIAAIGKGEYDDQGQAVRMVGVCLDISRRKQIELELQESEERYRHLVESANDWIWEVDAEGRYVFTSAHTREILGYDPQELLGKTPFDLMPPAEAERMRGLFNDFLAKKRPFRHLVNVNLHKDGHRVILESNGVPVFNDAGELQGYRGMDSDITERVLADEALRAKTEELDGFFDINPDLLCVADIDGYFHRVNREWAATLGYSLAQLENCRFLDYVHPDDIQSTLQALQDLAAGKYVTDFVNRYRCSDGTYRWLEWRAAPYHNGLVFAAARDITQKRKTVDILNCRVRLLEYAADHSLKELLVASLDEAELLTDSVIGFYHFVDPDEEHLTLQAWSTRTVRDFCTAVGEGQHYPVSQAGVWVDCLAQRKPVIHNDYHALPHKKGLPDGHAEIIRELVVPVFRNNRVVALLGVGNKPTDYQQEDIDVLSTLADLAWEITENKQAELALRESENHYRSLFQNMLNGLAYCRMVYEDGRPVDFVYLYVNETFGIQTGLHDVEGKRVTEIIPGIYETDRELIERYGRVATIGVPERFEVYVDALDMWFAVSAYSPERGYFVAVFDVITARKRAEQALKDSESKYRNIIENISDLYYRTDLEGRIIMVSPSVTRLLGYDSESEVLGLPIKSMWMNPELRAGLLQELDRAGAVRDYEAILRKKDGTPIHMSASSQYYYSEDGEKAGVEGMLRDITARIKSSEALQASELNLKKAQHLARVGSWTWDIPANRLVWSDEMYRIFGIGLDVDGEALRDVARRAVHPDDAARVEAGRQLVLRNQRPLPMEYRIVWPDGSTHIVWAEAGEIVTDESGAPVRLSGIVQDITERLRTEEQIMMMSRAVEQSTNGIMITDLAGIIEYVNDSIVRMTGYEAAELIGQSVEIFNSGEMSPEAEQEMWETIQSGRDWSGEFHNRKKDGSYYWEQSTITPVTDVAGHMTHYLAIKNDITAEKLAQEERLRLEDQLRQSQKMEAVGRLAGGVAHDFNNLLTVISGHAELALRQLYEGDPVRFDVEEITRTAQRAGDLTRQLLTFSRRQTISPIVVDLNKIVAEMKRMLGRVIGDNVQLVTSYGDDLMSIKADPGQIEQVVVNLAVNSRDAMPEGGTLSIETSNIRLDDDFVRIHPQVQTGDYVMLSVSDTGMGMTQEIMGRIFEPFFTTKPVGVGTGLGLATVYGIVKQSEGYIVVSSEVGSGTTFTIYFPALTSVPQQALDGFAADRRLRGKESVLLVEDNTSVRNMLGRVLDEYGYRVTSVPSAADALAWCESENRLPDLLVTDVVMPGMNGAELLDIVSQKWPQVRVLLMSGYTADAIPRRVAEQGFDLLQKPFGPVTFIARIREVLDRENR